MPDFEKILRSLVNDIGAMQQVEPNYFGPFSEGNDDDGYVIEWPNLAVMLDEAKAALSAGKEPALHEYAFSLSMRAVVRVKARDEQAARALLRTIDACEMDYYVDIDTDTPSGEEEVVITEVSAMLGDEEEADLFEIDGDDDLPARDN